MSAIVIVGAQWGDEGKGKVVDLYTENADMVVRFAGGPNAGHTLVVGDQKIVVRLVPSGILRPESICVLGQGMVIDLSVLLGEIEALEARGYSVRERLFVSDRAHLILPYHPLIDSLREETASVGNKIGTTKRGIGPAYEDKAARRGIVAGSLRNKALFREQLERSIAAWQPLAARHKLALPTAEEIVHSFDPLLEKFLPLLTDASKLVNDAMKQGKRVMLEGAQGTLLDIDHGTYPFVTSSSAVAGGACTGAGIGPTRIHRVIGLVKGYATRVGEGPFPTELFDSIGEQLRTRGGEFGSVTGRPRRTGWLDLPALRYAARVNGLDAIALTKLDVMAGLDEIKVCTEYETKGGRTGEFPIDELAAARPVFRSFEGYSADLSSARSFEALPKAARAYVEAIEEFLEIPVDVISVGPRRDETIVRRAPFA